MFTFSRIQIPHAPRLTSHLNAMAAAIEELSLRETVFGAGFETMHDGRTVAVAMEPPETTAAEDVCPIDILEFDSTAQTVKFRPLTVNQLVPSNFQDALSVANTVSYIYVHCATDGSQVNAVTLEVSSTPRPPPAVTMGSAPAAFDVLVWVVVRTADGQGYSFSKFKIWGCGNIAASPVEFIRTDKSSPAPGQSSYDIWYAWKAVLG